MAANLSRESHHEEAIIIPLLKSVCAKATAPCVTPAGSPKRFRRYDTVIATDSERRWAGYATLSYANKGDSHASFDKGIVGFGVRFEFVWRRLTHRVQAVLVVALVLAALAVPRAATALDKAEPGWGRRMEAAPPAPRPARPIRARREQRQAARRSK